MMSKDAWVPAAHANIALSFAMSGLTFTTLGLAYFHRKSIFRSLTRAAAGQQDSDDEERIAGVARDHPHAVSSFKNTLPPAQKKKVDEAAEHGDAKLKNKHEKGNGVSHSWGFWHHDHEDKGAGARTESTGAPVSRGFKRRKGGGGAGRFVGQSHGNER